MDAGVEATKERLPDARSKSPASAHGLDGRSPPSAKWGVGFSWILLFFGQVKEKYLALRRSVKAFGCGC
jgi:hypothetical protein